MSTRTVHRDLLKLITSYVLGVAGAISIASIVRFLSFAAAGPRPTQFDLGPAAAFGPNSRTILADVPALLIRDDQGFVALSLVCTHQGCTVEASDDGFECPCHGSRYNALGGVVRGPAPKPLERLSTEISSEGRLILRTT